MILSAYYLEKICVLHCVKVVNLIILPVFMIRLRVGRTRCGCVGVWGCGGRVRRAG